MCFHGAGWTAARQCLAFTSSCNTLRQVGRTKVCCAVHRVQDAVSALSNLSRLHDLYLADPFWGACPVASLSNYQTCVLAQLPQLTSLDTLVLAQETKAAAAATLAKKQLYYSMRTTTQRRAMRDLCRHAQAAQQVRRSAVSMAGRHNLAHVSGQRSLLH